MTGGGPIVPETRVLAVASHVVSGYVGNKIAVFTMQSLGCDVAALNTVQFSNHTGYRQWTGSKVSAEEITQLWRGLKQSRLDDFDMMLTGYIPGAEAVEAVGLIAAELKAEAASRPGRFFWVLDPVMGDNGRLYVAPEVVPAYQKLVSSADLILPNQFEAELLSGVSICDGPALGRAIQVLHERYGVPHVIITSVTLPLQQPQQRPGNKKVVSSLSVVGSTMTSGRRARPFKIGFPVIDAYFSGTGDMFGALMVVRMREAVAAAVTGGKARERVCDDEREGQEREEDEETLVEAASWRSPNQVDALELPLARAAEKVLASMHEVLSRTCEAMKRDLEAPKELGTAAGLGIPVAERERRMHLATSRAAELRLVRYLNSLRCPEVEFRAERL